MRSSEEENKRMEMGRIEMRSYEEENKRMQLGRIEMEKLLKRELKDGGRTNSR